MFKPACAKRSNWGARGHFFNLCFALGNPVLKKAYEQQGGAYLAEALNDLYRALLRACSTAKDATT